MFWKKGNKKTAFTIDRLYSKMYVKYEPKLRETDYPKQVWNQKNY